MHVQIPPSEKELNIAAVKRAIDRKQSEVEIAQRKLTDLQAELRGLAIALEAIDGKLTLTPRGGL